MLSDGASLLDVVGALSSAGGLPPTDLNKGFVSLSIFLSDASFVDVLVACSGKEVILPL